MDVNDMETTPVLIVGGGPAGVVLAIELAKHHIHSVILEKEMEIEQDPRAATLIGDAVRIAYKLGLGPHMSSIGRPIDGANFHRSGFHNPPWLRLDRKTDATSQTVPDGLLHIQPRLEAEMRVELHRRAKYCDLRVGHEVLAREEVADGVVVTYRNKSSADPQKIRCSWLVGADGKRGIVRKHFLEKHASIRQETGLFDYTGTWIAANLQIRLPSPKTHPDLKPLWDAGKSPEQVFELFWPDEWHFCCPPGRPTATGGLGPRAERYWRHEFEVSDWNSSMDSVALFWEHITPMITRSIDGTTVTYPADCIEIQRCRPYTFAQKVVNRWFYRRTIVIGDAAHIFPPFVNQWAKAFGGQGMASGWRDAHNLGWRLALLVRAPSYIAEAAGEPFLSAWAQERRQGIDDATRFTMMNGKMTIEGPPPAEEGFQPVDDGALETRGYKPTASGFFLADFGGGGKIAQVYVQERSGVPILSDNLLERGVNAMTLLVIQDGHGHGGEAVADVLGVKEALKEADLASAIVSDESILLLARAESELSSTVDTGTRAFYPCPETALGSQQEHPRRAGYDETSYRRSLGTGTKYALIRPDWIIFALAANLDQLKICLELLKSKLGGGAK